MYGPAWVSSQSPPLSMLHPQHPESPGAEGVPPCTGASASHSDFARFHPTRGNGAHATDASTAGAGRGGGGKGGGGAGAGRHFPGPPPLGQPGPCGRSRPCARGGAAPPAKGSRSQRQPGGPWGCCATARGSRSPPPPPGGRPATAAAPGGRCARGDGGTGDGGGEVPRAGSWGEAAA